MCISDRILPDRERLDEENPDVYSEELVRENLTEAVKQANSMVQQYKRIKKFLVRSEEFPKNTSKKIKRAGLLEEMCIRDSAYGSRKRSKPEKQVLGSKGFLRYKSQCYSGSV